MSDLILRVLFCGLDEELSCIQACYNRRLGCETQHCMAFGRLFAGFITRPTTPNYYELRLKIQRGLLGYCACHRA